MRTRVTWWRLQHAYYYGTEDPDTYAESEHMLLVSIKVIDTLTTVNRQGRVTLLLCTDPDSIRVRKFRNFDGSILKRSIKLYLLNSACTQKEEMRCVANLLRMTFEIWIKLTIPTNKSGCPLVSLTTSKTSNSLIKSFNTLWDTNKCTMYLESRPVCASLAHANLYDQSSKPSYRARNAWSSWSSTPTC